jgi:hypothetical protein
MRELSPTISADEITQATNQLMDAVELLSLALSTDQIVELVHAFLDPLDGE